MSMKQKFMEKLPHLNHELFAEFVRVLLLQLYPKTCPVCGGKKFKTISTRETELRCAHPKCKGRISLTSKTPLHNFKLPLSIFGYVLYEAIQLHPQPLTTSQICRKLNVGRSTGALLKRRLQLLLTAFIPTVKDLMTDCIEKDFESHFELPEQSHGIPSEIRDNAIVYGDTIALFRVTRRADNYRTRKRKNGISASVFLDDKTAVEKGFTQIGSIVLTQAMKKGPVLFTSVRDQTQETIEPLFDFLPKQTPVCTDQGFPFLERGRFNNYRYVNHSLRAKNQKRNVWGKDRYAKNGVHNNVAEGNQRSLKTAMKAYSYIRPEYSQLYLDEYSVLKAIRVFGFSEMIEKVGKLGIVDGNVSNTSSNSAQITGFLKHQISSKLYSPPMTPEEKNSVSNHNTRKKIPYEIQQLIKFQDFEELRNAVSDYYEYWFEKSQQRRKREKEYNAVAHKLFSHLKQGRDDNLRSLCNTATINHTQAIRIIRIWHKLKICNATCIQRRGDSTIHYTIEVNPIVNTLPDLLYTYDRADYEDLIELRNQIEVQKPAKNPRVPKYGVSKKEREERLKKANLIE